MAFLSPVDFLDNPIDSDSNEEGAAGSLPPETAKMEQDPSREPPLRQSLLHSLSSIQPNAAECL